MADEEQTKREGVRSPGAGAARLPITGEAVGRYVLEDALGEGGMGIVFAALDPELNRRVALKLVRPGSGADSQARLLREAQAMAQLSHPNVVPVFDVGMYGQRVFLAMELVEGETVRRWLKREPRSWRDVLALFVAAGRGLAAAHAAGIVHRDFKLDNVLVGRDGRARVTDFGLARAADEVSGPISMSGSPSPQSDLAELTEPGAMLGTPAYMAPEQRQPSAPADARADEYSFCVSLYEALYGARPIEPNSPDLPAAGKRGQVPTWIREILVRGLAASPDERWPDMPALLAALERDPAARRRHIVAGFAVLAGLVTIAVLALTRSPGSTCDDEGHDRAWNDARKALVRAAFLKTGRRGADEAFVKTAALLDQSVTAWRAARVNACRATRVRHQESEQNLTLRTACLDLQREQLEGFVGVLETADPKVVKLSIEAASALPRPSECDDVRSLEALRPPADPGARREIEALRLELASTRTLAPIGRPLEAIARFKPIVARSKQLGYRPLEAEAWFALGAAYYAQSDYVAAEDAMKQVELAADAGQLDRLAARAYARLVFIATIQGRLAEGEDWATRARARLERIGGDKVIEAELVGYIASLEAASGRIEQSIATNLQAIRLRSEVFGPADPTTLVLYSNLGLAYSGVGRMTDAIAAFQDNVDRVERNYGAQHVRLVVPLNNLGLHEAMTGRFDDAQRALERALAIATAELGDSVNLGVVLTTLAELRLEQQRPQEALDLAARAAAMILATAGDKSGPYGEALAVQGVARYELGSAAAALAPLQAGTAIVKSVDPRAPFLLEFLATVVEARLATGDVATAIVDANRGLEECKLPAHFPGVVAHARLAAARALVKTNRQQALELARLARDELAPLAYKASLLAKVDAFVAQLER